MEKEPPKTENLAETVRRCIAGDDAAREQFVARTLPIVQRSVAFTLGSGTGRRISFEVNDACNEVYLRLFANGAKRLEGLREPERLDAWMMTISRRVVIELLRKDSAYKRLLAKNKEKTVPPPSNLPSVYDCSEERIARIRRSFASLSEKERLMLALYYENGRTYREISRITGVPLNTVGSVISRAKSRIRKRMGIEEEKGAATRGAEHNELP